LRRERDRERQRERGEKGERGEREESNGYATINYMESERE
jgi:hypothetical protein